MKKEMLEEVVSAAKRETSEALQTMYDSLNQGQQNKLMKETTVADLLARYKVKV